MKVDTSVIGTGAPSADLKPTDMRPIVEEALRAGQLASPPNVAHRYRWSSGGIISARSMDPLLHVVRAAAGSRARPGRPPSPERLRELAEAISSRRYRVPPDEIAKALLRGRPARPD